MPGLLGKKIGMTHVFTEDGNLVPVTVVEAGPCEVLSIKNKEKDGYEALQLGFGTKKEKKVNKPQLDYYKKNSLEAPAVAKEFKDFNVTDYKLGDKITCEILTVGEEIKVSGESKGKGFQGVVKRHGFSGVGGQTHGQHNRERAPGSIGQSSWPSRVFKGMRMAGRMGHNKVTVSGVKVVKVVAEKNLVFLKGSVPGAINSIVEIKK